MAVLMASAGQVELNLKAGMWMSGYAARVDPSAGMHDPLMVKALLLDDGSIKVVIVSCDLVGFTYEACSQMRRRIWGRTGIPTDNILIFCTHTHSGPASMPFRGVLGKVDQVWVETVYDQVVELVCELSANMQPARFAHASVSVPGIASNRQDPAYPIDDELSIVSFESESGDVIATIANYSCHSVVLGSDNLLYSADYPGALTRNLQKLLRGTALFLQGSCGDVDPSGCRGTFEHVELIGSRLANAAVSALRNAPPVIDVQLDVRDRRIDVSLDPPPSPDELLQLEMRFKSDLQKAETAHDKAGELTANAMLGWIEDVREALKAGSVHAIISTEISILGINNIRLVASQFEAYSEIALRIKEQLRPLKVVFAGYCNGLRGYLASGWAKKQGGYGPGGAYRWFVDTLTPFGEGMDDLFVSVAVSEAQSISCSSRGVEPVTLPQD